MLDVKPPRMNRLNQWCQAESQREAWKAKMERLDLEWASMFNGIERGICWNEACLAYGRVQKMSENGLCLDCGQRLMKPDSKPLEQTHERDAI